MKAAFTKVESIGNDFVLLSAELTKWLDAKGVSTLILAPALCNRKFGIGADGILILGRQDDDLTLRMFNPDGSEDFCGNGLRCATQFAHAQGWMREQVRIHQLGRQVEATIQPNGEIETKLPGASYAPKDIPSTLNSEIFRGEVLAEGQWIKNVSLLSTGSTHMVIYVDEFPADDLFVRLSTALEHHESLPERTSVMWTKIITPGEAEIRIWERGAGETLGCGTGACAVAVDMMRRHTGQFSVKVRSKGGELHIAAPAWDAPLMVAGRAEIVYSGTLNKEYLNLLSSANMPGCC